MPFRGRRVTLGARAQAHFSMLSHDSNAKINKCFQISAERQEISGSGGFGDPSERDINAIKEDVLDGYISEEAAKTQYGVKNIRYLIDK